MKFGKEKRRLLWLCLGGVCLILGAAFWSYRDLAYNPYSALIQQAAKRYGVEPALVRAVIWQESRFNASARGRAQEIGLMQLREIAAQEWADAESIDLFDHENCLDPGTNTLAGTWYLKKLLKRYGQTEDPVPYALADYNAGRGNVLKWLNGSAKTNSAAFVRQIGFPGTQDYVRSVIRRRNLYRWLARIHWD